ncbi:MAG: HD domain-containing protein [Alloprevotella sp.]|nr:HD domain-containing protein [Bacteroidales bacterium]MDY3944365.1 HD domain-containing protein [Alloprevotella sp.]
MSVIIDPLYGFIDFPRGLIRRLINHPYFQRLDRIRQLGTSGFVYPSAQHTRKQHSLGAYHLVSEALRSLISKGQFIFDSEIEATQAALLMHDLGHGPYSHVLEFVFAKGIAHEEITHMMMNRLNKEFNGELTLALQIFKGQHPKHFLHELISSQLDMDRLDYLMRDSFYTGVREGSVGAERLIKMLDVRDEHLVIHQKGMYSVENYLMARRLMYWQVYLHKTTIAAEEVLRNALLRAKRLAKEGKQLFCTPALHYFLYNDIAKETFENSSKCLDYYIQLDDADILSALKAWRSHEDIVLNTLANNFLNRNLFKAEVFDAPISSEQLQCKKEELAKLMGLTIDQVSYFVSSRSVSKEMYSVTAEGIKVLCNDGEIKDFATLSQIISTDNTATSIKDTKHYLFYQRA